MLLPRDQQWSRLRSTKAGTVIPCRLIASEQVVTSRCHLQVLFHNGRSMDCQGPSFDKKKNPRQLPACPRKYTNQM